jgi:hypothetical protein
VGVALAGFLAVVQTFRIDRSNPPAEADVNAPAPVRKVMKRSGYGGHSDETLWLRHCDVAPASWMVAHELRQVRAN